MDFGWSINWIALQISLKILEFYGENYLFWGVKATIIWLKWIYFRFLVHCETSSWGENEFIYAPSWTLGPTARLQITLRWIVQLLWVNVRLYLTLKISCYIWRGPAISWKSGWFWNLNFPPLTVIGQFEFLVCAIRGLIRFFIVS